MNDNVFIKSDLGAKAAWRGFSCQTIYIAHRLLLLNDTSDFFPEKVEDLMLKKDGRVSELVQVKNLSSNLTLSDLLSKKDEDSFFNRCLACRSSNENIKLKVVSFGEIGPELQGLRDNDVMKINNIKDKFLKNGYSNSDVEWILKNLVFEQVDELELREKIYNNLSKRVTTMASPEIMMDILTSYISDLSRNSGTTNKENWEQRTQKIALGIASLSGMAKQYGNTIFPIYEYKSSKSSIDLKTEYLAGVNGRAQHIRANLDITRTFWIEKIDELFESFNTVIIKGASGQGKSSLAYRYLLNTFTEDNILCIEKVTNEEQAIDISSALAGIAKNRDESLVVYLDVSPYDTNWLWLCEQLYSKNKNIKLLITIREEDFKRSPIDYSKHHFGELELNFSKEEANEIFTLYKNHDFLSFENAWKSFGETGPLMEFVYMLNQSKVLKQRLRAQVDMIIQHEEHADEWLEILAVICYAGKYNIHIDAIKLFLVIECPQKRKMLKVFEKEYFLRQSKDGKYLECLHALRASILYDIFREDAILPEIEVLIKAMQSINGNAMMMLVEYVYQFDINDNLITRLSLISYESWELLASVLKALLWAEVWHYYQSNKEIIMRGDQVLNNVFIMLGLGDVSGYYNQVNIEDIKRFIPLDSFSEMVELVEKLSSRVLEYKFLDKFIEKIFPNLPLNKEIEENEMTALGYSLFWMAKRNFLISEKSAQFSFSGIEKRMDTLLDSYMNMMIGIQEQGWEVNNSIRKKILPKIISKYNIVSLDSTDHEITAYAILPLNDSDGNSPYENGYIMKIIFALRRLYSNKEKYNVEIIGGENILGLEINNPQKNIEESNLPWIWITQVNKWLYAINEYNYFQPNWDICLNNIDQTRSEIITMSKDIISGLDYWYKKGNIKKLITEELQTKRRKIIEDTKKQYRYYPQSELDKYGVKGNNNIVDTNEKDFESVNIDEKKNLTFRSVFRDYYNNFSNYILQMNDLILCKAGQEFDEQTSRLSLINIISALEKLPEIQFLYQNQFQLKNREFNNVEEYNQIILLASLWTYVYNNKYRAGSSILYDQKEYIKKYSNRIDTFFTMDVSKIEGVLKVDRENTTIIINIDLERMDFIRRELFTQMKELLPEVGIHTLEGFLWDRYISEIYIFTNFERKKLTGKYKIKGSSFKLYDELEKFMAYLEAFEIESLNNINYENITDRCFITVQITNNFQILSQHISQVSQKIAHLDKKNFVSSTYVVWKETTESYLKEILQIIIENIHCIYNSLKDEKIFIEQDLAEVTKLIGNNNISEMISSDNHDKLNEYFTDLQTVIIQFVDLIPRAKL
ncbi:hypothetical protein HCA15_00170 [Listeria booriae]|uniref:hypothetical protein n=2 Tax=Listeria TaxID=1637 RepID=UPI00164DAB90|nr:hypothetical protein [Listeria booriae]MBC6165038.1 hypothetical protein [Listeria booriae]